MWAVNVIDMMKRDVIGMIIVTFLFILMVDMES